MKFPQIRFPNLQIYLIIQAFPSYMLLFISIIRYFGKAKLRSCARKWVCIKKDIPLKDTLKH